MSARHTLFAGLAAALLLAAAPARAWGPEGHHVVGALADRLLAGTPAAAKVKELLGGLSLRDAAVWADCAKGVDPAQDYRYPETGRYPECAPFESAEGLAELADYVRRNDRNCDRRPNEESCHKQYHYTDVAIQRGSYRRSVVGTREDDLVAAIGAAMLVLQGRPAPPPFAFATPREALLLLAHYLGDLHQPLHVGAVYLDAKGRRIDPDAGPFQRATDTRGGNQINTVNPRTHKLGGNLHREWDDLPAALGERRLDAAWLAQARALKPPKAAPASWPAAWAGDTLLASRQAFTGLTFGPRVNSDWTVTLPASYNATMATIKKRQLTRAGAHLAQVLKATWP